MNSVDFIHTNIPKSDINLFGLEDPVEFDFSTWADVAVYLKIFPSKGQAKKNGWSGTLEEGFQQRFIKKNGLMITILNYFEED